MEEKWIGWNTRIGINPRIPLELDDDDRSMNVNVDGGGGNPHLKPLPRTAAIRLPLFMTSQIRSREKRTID